MYKVLIDTAMMNNDEERRAECATTMIEQSTTLRDEIECMQLAVGKSAFWHEGKNESLLAKILH